MTGSRGWRCVPIEVYPSTGWFEGCLKLTTVVFMREVIWYLKDEHNILGYLKCDVYDTENALFSQHVVKNPKTIKCQSSPGFILLCHYRYFNTHYHQDQMLLYAVNLCDPLCAIIAILIHTTTRTRCCCMLLTFVIHLTREQIACTSKITSLLLIMSEWTNMCAAACT